MNKKYLAGIPIALMFCASLLFVGCSTITPYPLDIAFDGQTFEMTDKVAAVAVIELKSNIRGKHADYGSFAMDADGFSYIKTTEKMVTKFEEGKAKKFKRTQTLTQNVPWSAITQIEPYLVEYNVLLADAFMVRVKFNTVTVVNKHRRKEARNIELKCKTREDLVAVTGALRSLTNL